MFYQLMFPSQNLEHVMFLGLVWRIFYISCNWVQCFILKVSDQCKLHFCTCFESCFLLFMTWEMIVIVEERYIEKGSGFQHAIHLCYQVIFNYTRWYPGQARELTLYTLIWYNALFLLCPNFSLIAVLVYSFKLI